MAEPKIVILEKSLNQLQQILNQGEIALRKDENVTGGTTITYIGIAYPGTSESDSRWGIKKTTIVVSGGDTITTVEYPINTKGNADVGKKFKWTERKTTLTYK